MYQSTWEGRHRRGVSVSDWRGLGFLERERGGCAVGFVWQISSKILAAISKEFHFGNFFFYNFLFYCLIF